MHLCGHLFPFHFNIVSHFDIQCNEEVCQDECLLLESIDQYFGSQSPHNIRVAKNRQCECKEGRLIQYHENSRNCILGC